MRLPQEIFYAKLLLFGEYSVICGSMALSVPFGHFKGELSFLGQEKYTDYDFAVSSNQQLKEYFNNLKENVACHSVLDLKAFEKDLASGLFFESTIPQGYGLGSSGALTAAVYARYAFHRIPFTRNLSDEAIKNLRKTFSLLESFFHGTSSGFDPLSSYLKLPLLILPGNIIRITSVPRNRDYGKAGIFLLNTGLARKTQNLVENFLMQCKQDNAFGKMISREYIPLTNLCIQSLIEGNVKNFTRHLKILSSYQLLHFHPMIPKGFGDVWESGINRKLFYLKLCGAGGGGFLLGFAKNLDAALNWLSERNFSTVTVYRSH
ncbi:MAG: mevalonate kinase [Bacteroidales bacterium]|nr:mevalonate kinase [Bacteroidales bacterium]